MLSMFRVDAKTAYFLFANRYQEIGIFLVENYLSLHQPCAVQPIGCLGPGLPDLLDCGPAFAFAFVAQQPASLLLLTLL